MNNYEYEGNELELFSVAKNWKGYWSKKMRPYLGRNVLEVGSGISSISKLFPQKDFSSWTCLEPDSIQCKTIVKEIKVGNLPQRIKVVNGNISSLKNIDKFDTIFYIDVLEHIELDKQELINAANCLSAHGYLAILSPAHNFLFSNFDTSVGHFRRYNKKMLNEISPESLKIVSIFYLDSLGMLASYFNKYFLKAKDPTLHQILFWDRFIVLISKVLDRIFFYRIGKSIVCIYQKNNE